MSRETLEATPARVVVFLRAVGTSPAIRGALSARGYDEQEHRQGWSLLHAASGFSAAGGETKPTATDDGKVAGAISALDAWDEGGFRVVRAALGRLHPSQCEFVLKDLAPSTGAAAVVGVKALLDRLDTLESGASRKASREADHAALATLTKRGITKEERARLRALVKQAEAYAPMVTPERSSDAKGAGEDETHLAALVALRAWFEDWSEMARVAIKRKDHLIRLGLAQRKTAKRGGKEG